MQPSISESLSFRHAETEADLVSCLEVMLQSRSTFATVDEFRQSLSRRWEQSHRILVAWRGARCVGLAGYRFMENLVHGVFMQIDDLVTCESVRGQCVKAQLIAALQKCCEDARADTLVLHRSLPRSPNAHPIDL